MARSIARKMLRRFENGNHNYLGLAVTRRAASFLSAVGLTRIEAGVHLLSTELMRRLAERGYAVVTPHPEDGRAVSVRTCTAVATRDVTKMRRVVTSVRAVLHGHFARE